MFPTVRRALPSLPLLAAAFALAACASGSGAPDVAVPTPEGEAARACRALERALPERVVREERGTLDQDTPYAAVWGDPPIVLRCGVSPPARLTPGSAEYDPTDADVAELNGVAWLMEEEPDGFRFTTAQRTVYVEVTVPDAYAPDRNPLIDLAEPIARHIPLDPLYADDGQRHDGHGDDVDHDGGQDDDQPDGDAGQDDGDAAGGDGTDHHHH